MVIRIGALTVIFFTLDAIALAHDIGGRYRSQGTFANGNNFSVTVEIMMKSDDTCSIKWSDGVAGICMLKGTKLMTAGVVAGGPQLGFYEVATDGSIEGLFIDDYNGDGFSKEKMIPID
jgi:hypothetical protein